MWLWVPILLQGFLYSVCPYTVLHGFVCSYHHVPCAPVPPGVWFVPLFPRGVLCASVPPVVWFVPLFSRGVLCAPVSPAYVECPCSPGCVVCPCSPRVCCVPLFPRGVLSAPTPPPDISSEWLFWPRFSFCLSLAYLPKKELPPGV
jgi:hypothetical protein